jgi:segregation and condensation protein A
MYKVQLEQFEGPLDLLLYFIKRDELNIYDIPISQITADYMETIQTSKEVNIGTAGEFIHMAATLMRIKSKMLLPLSSHDEEDNIEDPRLPLVRQLLEYKRYKEAAESLDSMAENRSHYFTRGKIKDISSVEEEAAVFVRNVSLFDIATYFKTAMDNKPVISQYELHREPMSIEDQKAKLLAFVDGDGILRFSSLIERLRDKVEIVITFLAILDLIREAKILLIQNELFGEIEIQLIWEKN